ncbi:hypothetical protein TELCIR_12869 [Teladorsagia circumcincta]|uniref:SET domain-containing protein n=1 Tax=Teladorsagia circumcincta TaxID=45464 RepID=A0A2G9U712_TELCI|nr:hypothetical protein TELCIR_12869 [Teladorsagia circumcincta]
MMPFRVHFDKALNSETVESENKENTMDSELEKAELTLSDRISSLQCSAAEPEDDLEGEVEEVDMLAAADTRERLVSQMAARMQQKDPQAFAQAFPNFHRRHDYTSWHRVHLRMTEQAINDELEGLGIAPIYFENWTDDERATIDVKYLTRCAMSISNYREAKATGVALRLQYPEDGAGYFNHACGDAANLKAVSLLSRGNLLTNNMLFFTKRMISKGEELTFSYRGKDAEEQKNGIRCLCTPGCQSRL